MSISKYENVIKQEAGNFIYLFLADKYLQSTAYFGRYTSRIKAKKEKQQAYLKGLIVASGDGISTSSQQSAWNSITGWIRDAIADTYAPVANPTTGKTEDCSPEAILYYLSQGQDIAGKNWQKGVYGVGSVPVTTWQNYTLDSETGVVSKDGSTAGLVQSTIYNDGSITGTSVYDSAGGVAISTALTSSGYTLATQTNSSGTTKSVSTSQEKLQNTLLFLQNLNAMMPQISNLCNSLATALSGVSPTEITPSQTAEGWVKESGSSDLVTTAALGAGALLIGSVVLGKDKKK